MLMDFYKTCVDILGCETKEDEAPDSCSQLSIWKGEALDMPLHEALIHHSVNGAFSIRQGPWKLEMCPGSGGWTAPQPGSLPENCHPIQLYNLDRDIRERHNVCDEHPEIVHKLKNTLTHIVNEDGNPYYGMEPTLAK